MNIWLMRITIKIVLNKSVLFFYTIFIFPWFFYLIKYNYRRILHIKYHVIEQLTVQLLLYYKAMTLETPFKNKCVHKAF